VQCSAVYIEAVQCAVQCSAVQCSAVQCSAVCSAVQYILKQCSAVQYILKQCAAKDPTDWSPGRHATYSRLPAPAPPVQCSAVQELEVFQLPPLLKVLGSMHWPTLTPSVSLNLQRKYCITSNEVLHNKGTPTSVSLSPFITLNCTAALHNANVADNDANDIAISDLH
jgi:hypothetical protein